ncbi:snurportin-1 isoform X1 [Frankliniella occidentalis]|uniref:Snurportin-1 n=1 Tax=Frankliniella occidentalis TaxID=133901 RepID=A0A6J1SU03_FRAOC|nr:snurportin-1 isoform X1 [Frankliniella occidentalis]
MAASIDQLVASLDTQCDVASNPFDPNRPHPRLSEFAYFREPASLMGDQEKRRTEFLERQKSKREKLVNLQRRLLNEPGEVLNNQDSEDNLSPDKKETKSTGTEQRNWTFTNQLMLSEWLVDIPPDLEDNWLIKPCPKGRRMMVVAHKGSTKAYSKAGHFVASFASALPNANSSSPQGITILDCIWNMENRTYFVLDVLAWNNLVLLDCETEFRFYWLKTKLDEFPEVQTHSDKNRNAFLALPSYECQENLMTELMSHNPMFFEGKDPGLDGLLFYHKKNLYEHGSTPLVTWIKPFMMEDVLGIKVHQNYIDERPAGYCNQAGYIKEFEEAALARRGKGKGKGSWRRREGKQDEDKMDCLEEGSSSDKKGKGSWRRRGGKQDEDKMDLVEEGSWRRREKQGGDSEKIGSLDADPSSKMEEEK